MNDEMEKEDLTSKVKVGSFFLETLTTGMYTEPLDALREYIQNSADAIALGVASGRLAQDEGTVKVEISRDSAGTHVAIEDNGPGIPEAQALDTLLALGMSAKRSHLNAGFRGIGRLAGIAYCTMLRYTTKHYGENRATILEFDCGNIIEDMRPNASATEISEFLGTRATATSSSEGRCGDTEEHFTRVDLVQVNEAGAKLVDLNRVQSYLIQYAPVDYQDDFPWKAAIWEKVAELGLEVPVIKLKLRHPESDEIDIRKGYKQTHRTSDQSPESFILENLMFVWDPADKYWFCWYGCKANFPGEIKDRTVAGLRFRTKNIQIGGPDIIEKIIEDGGVESDDVGSNRRLMRSTIGEVLVYNHKIVPNARRDGFEDSPEWFNLQKTLREQVGRKIVELVRRESNARSKLRRVRAKIDGSKSRIRGVGPDGIRTVQDAADVRRALARQVKSLESLEQEEASSATTRAKIKEILAELSNLGPEIAKKELEIEKSSVQPLTPAEQIVEVVEGVISERLSRAEVLVIMRSIRARLKKRKLL